MLINWFTVGAQVLNFIILLWLMKHFLYKPILKAIDARSQKIAAELASADAKEKNANQKSEQYTKKNEEFDKQRTALLDKATADANQHRTDLLAAVKKEGETLRTQQQEALRQEQKSTGQDIQRRAQDEIFSVIRKTLHDLADITLEDRIVEVFIQKIRATQGSDLDSFKKAIAQKSEPLVVRSTYGVNPDQRKKLGLALNEVFGSTTEPQYVLSSNLIAGIEISVGGRKISWSISDYLNSFSQNMEQKLDAL